MPFETLEDMIVATAAMVRPLQRLTVAEASETYRWVNNPGAYVGPWQNSTTPYLVEPMELLSSVEHTGMIFVAPAQTGKALAVDTPMAAPAGWTTMGALKVRDQVFGRDGQPCRVTFATEIMRATVGRHRRSAARLAIGVHDLTILAKLVTSCARARSC